MDFFASSLGAALGVGLTVIFVVLPLMLLARISHWAHLTQRKLDETNRLLGEMKKMAERGS